MRGPLLRVLIIGGFLLAATGFGPGAFGEGKLQTFDSFDSFDPAGAGKPIEEEAKSGKDRPGRQVSVSEGKMVQAYVDMYSRHLESKDWVTRAVGVVGLARLDYPQVTQKLFDVLEGDPLGVVQVYAWESLHARYGSLSKEQKLQWLEAGRRLYGGNCLGGELRASLLRAVGPLGPEPGNVRIFTHLFDHTNSLRPDDKETLDGMRNILAKWRQPALIKRLILGLSAHDHAFRAQHVLSGLGPGIPKALPDDNEGVTDWIPTQQAWAQWYKGRESELVSGEPRRMQPYRGRSTLLPPPERLVNAFDTQLRRGLELPNRVDLEQLDVTFVVDSTGSMGPALVWMKCEVAKLMRAFGMISRRPRIGVTFYRDHGDTYVVHPIPMSNDGLGLARAVSGVWAEGGADIPEAVYEGLAYAVTKQRWSSGPNARKVIVLIGDAPPHKDTVGKIRELVTTAAKDGFTFHCLKIRTESGDGNLPDFDNIAKWGGGKSERIQFGSARPDRMIFAEVMKTIIDESYHGYVPPFSNVLLAYADRSIPEVRPRPRFHEPTKIIAGGKPVWQRGGGGSKKGGSKKGGSKKGKPAPIIRHKPSPPPPNRGQR